MVNVALAFLLSLIVTGANRHDVLQIEAVLNALMVDRPNPPVRWHKHLCADAGYTGAPALKVIEKHDYAPHVKASGAMGRWVLARLSEQTTAACR